MAGCSGAHGGGGQERAEGDHQVKDIHIWPVDAALAECSYLVNCRPLQLTPGPGGED